MKKEIYTVKDLGTMQTIYDALDILNRINLYFVGCVSDHRGTIKFSENVVMDLDDHLFRNPIANTYYRIIIKTVREIDQEGGGYGQEALVLICSMLSECIRFIAAGVSQTEIIKNIEKLRSTLIQKIKEQSRPRDTIENDSIFNLLKEVDEELGGLIVKAFEDVGYKGLIQINASNGSETTYECISGHSFERGFMSRYMATDDEGKECILSNPLIVVTERPVVSVDDIVYFMTAAAEQHRPLLLIAEHVEDKPLQVMLYNKKAGQFESAAIQAPKYGTERKLFLSDIAAIVGATVIGADTLELRDAIADQHRWMFGGAERVVINKERTVIYNGDVNKNKLILRCNNLLEEISTATDEKKKEFISDRIALLTGKIGRIYIGGMKAEADAKIRIAERMLVYAREAVHSGLIIEAPYALLHASNKIYCEGKKEDYIYKALCRLLVAPLHAQLNKAKLVPEIIIGGLNKKSENAGYDIKKKVYIKDMFAYGKIGSAGSLITAIDKALSTVSILTSIEHLVVE